MPEPATPLEPGDGGSLSARRVTRELLLAGMREMGKRILGPALTTALTATVGFIVAQYTAIGASLQGRVCSATPQQIGIVAGAGTGLLLFVLGVTSYTAFALVKRAAGSSTSAATPVPRPQMRIHGKRVAFRYEIDSQNLCTVTRVYNGARVSLGALVLPFSLDYSYASNARIVGVELDAEKTEGGAYFEKPWTPDHDAKFAGSIHFPASDEYVRIVTVRARVQNAFAATAADAEERAQGRGVPAGRDFQDWEVTSSSWEELHAEFYWPNDRKVANPMLMISEEVLGARFRAVPRVDSEPTGRMNEYLCVDGSHWIVHVSPLTAPLKVRLTWTPG